jgi:hypothetical protein
MMSHQKVCRSASSRGTDVGRNVRIDRKYRHPSLSTVNWLKKNRVLRELHREVSIQKLESTAQYCTSVRMLQECYSETALSEAHNSRR